MEDELYLENIDEFVTDQNRVVTYKWLSYTLGVHVNQAKQMLYDYVERKRKENSGAQLHVTYLVAGNLVQNGHTCHKVAVVKEEKLEAMKSKLSTIASVHVYSIQKAMLKDSSPLYNTDYDVIKANLQNCSKFSAIHCAAAVARTAAEMSRAETPAQVDRQPPHGVDKAATPVVNGHAPSASSKQTSQQAKGIMGMFAAKSSTKSQETPKETKVEAKETPSVTFLLSLVTNAGKASPEPEQRKEEKAAAKSPVEPKSLPGAPECEKPSKKADPARGQQKDKKRTKRLEMSDEEEKEVESLKRKRRRIKQPQPDSSEDEGKWKMGEAARIRDFPVVQTVHTALLFPVTEKAYESESCTDSEGDFRSKPSAARKPPAGAAKKEPKEEKRGAKRATKANKQASIMGFFQKK
uniref:DNA polymerase delta subunit 3 n=1 Tax=Podarcis muralis TaxID=64176 RepID=A0A670HRG7_PODMU